jgi:murein DD-endopeptidase MepM/ murein hydrolase activator NlpD
MSLLKLVKKELKRRLTVMLIPHNSIKPQRISFTFSFLLFLLFSWTLFTLWAGYLTSRHIDYWRMKADHRIMQLKVTFFAQQLKNSREMLDQARENDEQVRTLLNMKSRQAIIEDEGKGGPTDDDRHDLTRLMSGTIHEISQSEISRQAVALQEEAKQRLQSYKEVMQYVESLRQQYRSTPSIWPCIGRVTSPFGFRVHPVYTSYEFHAGLDIANAKNTSIYATADGVVKLCDWQPGYGRLIVIDHGHGCRTYYGHLQKILVRYGDRIRRGQLIGLMGSTGTSTGNHVHYEIQQDGQPTNPARFLKKRPQQVAFAQ